MRSVLKLLKEAMLEAPFARFASMLAASPVLVGINFARDWSDLARLVVAGGALLCFALTSELIGVRIDRGRPRVAAPNCPKSRRKPRPSARRLSAGPPR